MDTASHLQEVLSFESFDILKEFLFLIDQKAGACRGVLMDQSFWAEAVAKKPCINNWLFMSHSNWSSNMEVTIHYSSAHKLKNKDIEANEKHNAITLFRGAWRA